MNKGHKLLVSTLGIIVALTTGACGSNNSGGSGNSSTSTSTTGYVPPIFSGGASVTLNNVNNLILSQYVGYPVTASSAITLNINVTSNNNSTGVYLGTANIAFQDTNGNSHNPIFYNGTTSDYGNNQNILTTDSATGLPTYRFFFEDQLGAIIITLQNSSGGTDTHPVSLNGIVYFRNFNTTAPNPLYQGYLDSYGNYWPPNPHAFCWSGQITTGPYDCRNFSVQPATSGNYAFTKLGTFTGIPSAALGL